MAKNLCKKGRARCMGMHDKEVSTSQGSMANTQATREAWEEGNMFQESSK
jgi:hypothetical protein